MDQKAWIWKEKGEEIYNIFCPLPNLSTDAKKKEKNLKLFKFSYHNRCKWVLKKKYKKAR